MDQIGQRLQLAQKGRQELQTKLGEATEGGTKTTISAEIANVDAAIQKLNDLKAQTDAALATKLGGIDKNSQEEAAKAQIESANKIREQGAKDFEEANKQLENQITADADQAGKQRADLWAEEYKQRVALLQSALYSGQIDEQKYNDELAKAQHAMYEGQKHYNDELERTQQIEAENAEGAARTRLRSIETNPYLSQQEKSQQSIGPLQTMLMTNASAQAGRECRRVEPCHQRRRALKSIGTGK